MSEFTRTFTPTLRQNSPTKLTTPQVDDNFSGLAAVSNAASRSYTASSQEAMLALSPAPNGGDYCWRSDMEASYLFLGGNAASIDNWATASFPVPSVFGRHGDVVAQTGDYSVGQITGALSIYDLASTSDVAKGDTLIGVKQPFAGSVGRTQHDKNGDTVSAKDFGAKGDGVTDDTAAIQAMVAAINANPSIARVAIDGVYLIDLSVIKPVDGSGNSEMVMFAISRPGVSFYGGGSIRIKAGSYGSGCGNGVTWSYYLFQATSDHVTFEGINVDGNGQWTQHGFSPSSPNVYLHPFSWLGTTGAHLKGAWASLCSYINGCGWAARGTYCDGGVLSNIYAEHSLGIGWNGGSNNIISGCRSKNAHDAHYGIWNGTNFSVVGNVADYNDNGSGIDIAGSSYGVVTGNTVLNNSARALWITYNSFASPEFIVVSGNTFYSNTNTPITEGGEIHVGAYDVSVESSAPGGSGFDGRYISIVNNAIFPKLLNGVTLGPFADNVYVSGNHIQPAVGASPTGGVHVYKATNCVIGANFDTIGGKVIGNNAITIIDQASSWDMTSYFGAAGGIAASKRIGNVSSESLVSSNNAQHYALDNLWSGLEFRAKAPINSSTDVVRLGWTSGGYQDATIEVYASAGGNRGVVGMRYYYTGYSAVTPSSLATATTIFTAGSNPPSITATPSAGGNLTISVANGTSVNTAIHVKVVGVAISGTSLLA